MIGVLVVLGVVVIALAILAIRSRSELAPWLDTMRRVHTGKVRGGEWIAPKEVVAEVIRHYEETIEFAAETLMQGWVPYARDLDRYLTGDFLKLQRFHLDQRLRRDHLRLIDILRADHQVRVRHFAGDGLSCILLDYQTERRLATYHYWSKRRVHTQHLDDTVMVYRMVYDSQDQRWKIATFIQELPASFGPIAIDGPLEQLQLTLPPYTGRDQ